MNKRIAFLIIGIVLPLIGISFGVLAIGVYAYVVGYQMNQFLQVVYGALAMFLFIAAFILCYLAYKSIMIYINFNLYKEPPITTKFGLIASIVSVLVLGFALGVSIVIFNNTTEGADWVSIVLIIGIVFYAILLLVSVFGLIYYAMKKVMNL